MRWRPRWLAFVAHLDNVTTHVVAALGAHGMRWHRGAALGAETGLLGLLLMMATAAAGTGVRMASLWYCHGRDTSKNTVNAVRITNANYHRESLGNLPSSASYGQPLKLSSRNGLGRYSSILLQWLGGLPAPNGRGWATGRLIPAPLPPGIRPA